MPDATSEENKPEAVGLGEARLLNLPVDAKRDQLLTEQSIFGDEFGSTAHEVRRR
jgi:hypothetical protein